MRLVAVALLCGACAATTSGPSKKQVEYVKTHPLAPDEEHRLYARESKRGDTIDRVMVTCDDCEFGRASADGDLVIWRVHVPIDRREFRLDTDKLETVAPGGDAMLTFKNEKLQSVVVLQ